MKSKSVIIQMKATERYFLKAVFFCHKMFLTSFESVSVIMQMKVTEKNFHWVLIVTVSMAVETFD